MILVNQRCRVAVIAQDRCYVAVIARIMVCCPGPGRTLPISMIDGQYLAHRAPY